MPLGNPIICFYVVGRWFSSFLKIALDIDYDSPLSAIQSLYTTGTQPPSLYTFTETIKDVDGIIPGDARWGT